MFNILLAVVAGAVLFGGLFFLNKSKNRLQSGTGRLVKPDLSNVVEIVQAVYLASQDGSGIRLVAARTQVYPVAKYHNELGADGKAFFLIRQEGDFLHLEWKKFGGDGSLLGSDTTKVEAYKIAYDSPMVLESDRMTA